MASHGRYKDNSENRRLHRVGQEYGRPSAPEESYEGLTTKVSPDAIAGLIKKYPYLKRDDFRQQNVVGTLKRIVDREVGGKGHQEALSFINSLTINSELKRQLKRHSMSHHIEDFDFGKYTKDDGMIDPVEAVTAHFPELKHLVKRGKGGKPDVSDFTESAVREAGVDWDRARAFVEKIYSKNRSTAESKKQNRDLEILEGNGTAEELMGVYSRRPAQVVAALDKFSEKTLDDFSQLLLEQIGILKDSDSIADLNKGVNLVELRHKVVNTMLAKQEKRFEEEKRQETERIRKEEEAEMKRSGETYTRVHLPDVPQSGKVNLKKYLSAVRRKKVDDEMSSMSRMDIASIKEVYESVRDSFNSGFDGYSKATRAEQLYRIMRFKELIEKGEKSEGDSIAKILGIQKGEPMTHEQADESRANPNFYRGGSSWTQNCQCCVLAYEMRRRGYDVEASPWGGDRNSVQYYLALDPARGFIKGLTSKGEPIAQSTMAVISEGASTTSRFSQKVWGSLKRNLNKNTEKEGRYFVSFRWRSGNKGHVIVVERKNGLLSLFDPQSGKNHDIDYYAQFADPRIFKILRVDNLEINPDVIKKKAVLPRNK